MHNTYINGGKPMDYKKIRKQYISYFQGMDPNENSFLLYKDREGKQSSFAVNKPLKLILEYEKNLKRLEKIKKANQKIQKEIDESIIQLVDVINSQEQQRYDYFMDAYERNLYIYKEYVLKIKELKAHFIAPPENVIYSLHRLEINKVNVRSLYVIDGSELVNIQTTDNFIKYYKNHIIFYKTSNNENPSNYNYWFCPGINYPISSIKDKEFTDEELLNFMENGELNLTYYKLTNKKIPSPEIYTMDDLFGVK